MEKAILAGGCFWCTEAVFQNIKGVEKVISGYIDGKVKNPTYKEVCTGLTGHTEAIEITFDPEVISFEQLLEIFWTAHDPTTLNRQGNDIGTQYRSGIYFLNAEQEQQARHSIENVASEIWDDPIVTEVKPATVFYPAEGYHQNYYNNHRGAGYCAFVITPKVSKVKQKFAHLLKS